MIATVTVPALSYGRTITIYAPTEYHETIRRMSPVLQYGPDFDRRVFDTLCDASQLWRRAEYPHIAEMKYRHALMWICNSAHTMAIAEDMHRS